MYAPVPELTLVVLMMNELSFIRVCFALLNMEAREVHFSKTKKQMHASLPLRTHMFLLQEQLSAELI